MRPVRDFVLVEIIEEDASKPGVLSVARDKTDSYQRGTVVASGPGRYEYGEFVPNEFPPNETIRWAQGADYGATFEENGKKYALIRASQVMAVEVK